MCRSELARDDHIFALENGVVRRATGGNLLALATPALPHTDGFAGDGEGDFFAGAAAGVGHD